VIARERGSVRYIEDDVVVELSGLPVVLDGSMTPSDFTARIMTPLLPEPDSAEERPYNATPIALTRAGTEALSKFATIKAARQIDRLEADRELLTTIGLESFDGPVTSELLDALVEYGFAVIGAWLNPKTDRLYVEANAKGYGIAEFARRSMFTDDHRHDLRIDVVVTSVPTFLTDVLAKGRWDHRKGASIKTYFIGWCVMQFRNVFRKFLRDHESEFVRHAELDTDEHDPSQGGNPAAIIAADETQAELLAQVTDETTRAILILRADGYGNAEIADLLQITIGAVESRWHRWKRDHHMSEAVA
jgi:hypothetical protein